MEIYCGKTSARQAQNLSQMRRFETPAEHEATRLAITRGVPQTHTQTNTPIHTPTHTATHLYAYIYKLPWHCLTNWISLMPNQAMPDQAQPELTPSLLSIRPGPPQVERQSKR